MACTSSCERCGEEDHHNFLRYFRFKNFALLVQYGTFDAIHNLHGENPANRPAEHAFPQERCTLKKNSSAINFDVILMKQPTRKLHSLII
jgi:hypothetical protein